MRLRNYPFGVVQFSCGKCLRTGRYKKSALIEKYTADIPLPDLRSHIAHEYKKIFNVCEVKYTIVPYGSNAELRGLQPNHILPTLSDFYPRIHQ